MTQQYCNNGLAPTTRSTYAAGQQRYTAFCGSISVHPIPATEQILLLFATHLATTKISHATIKVYLSAIRQLHVAQGSLQYFNQQLTPHLQQTLKGIQKTQTATNPPKPRLPITVDIMQDIKHLLLHKPQSYTNTMIWAACCLAFLDSRGSVNSPYQPRTSMISLAISHLIMYPWTAKITHTCYRSPSNNQKWTHFARMFMYTLVQQVTPYALFEVSFLILP